MRIPNEDSSRFNFEPAPESKPKQVVIIDDVVDVTESSTKVENVSGVHTNDLGFEVTLTDPDNSIDEETCHAYINKLREFMTNVFLVTKNDCVSELMLKYGKAEYYLLSILNNVRELNRIYGAGAHDGYIFRRNSFVIICKAITVAQLGATTTTKLCAGTVLMLQPDIQTTHGLAYKEISGEDSASPLLTALRHIRELPSVNHAADLLFDECKLPKSPALSLNIKNGAVQKKVMEHDFLQRPLTLMAPFGFERIQNQANSPFSQTAQFQQSFPHYNIPVILTEFAPVWPSRVYPIYGQHCQLEFIIQEFTGCDGQLIQNPVAVYGYDDCCTEHVLPCPPEEKTSFLNYPDIQNCKYSPIMLMSGVHVAGCASSIKHYDISLNSFIPSSWYGSIDNVNWPLLKGREVVCLIRNTQLEDLTVEIQLMCDIYQKLKDYATVKFYYCDFTNNDESLVLNYEGLQKLIQSKGITVTIPLCIEPKALDDARLPPADKIVKRKVIIGDVAKSASIICIGAPPKLGKSWLVQRLTYGISQGGTFFEHELAKSNVLLFDTELTDDEFDDRGYADKQSESFHIILAKKIPRIAEEDDIERLKRYLSMIKEYVLKHNIDVIAIDCLYKLFAESSEKQAKLFIDMCEDLVEIGKLVILVHHANKAMQSDDPFVNLAGHSTIGRAISGGFMLVPTGQKYIDENGNECPHMKMVYQCRGFRTPNDKILYLGDGKDGAEHMIDEKAMEQQQAPSASHDALEPVLDKMQKLHRFIRENVPPSKDEALPTRELLKLMVESDDVEWSESMLPKKLNSWVKKKLLSVTGNKPKRYYRGARLM